MPSYSYNDGDGLAVLDVATPDGDTEPVSNLDDAVKQIKAFLKDPDAGVQLLMDERAAALPTTVIVTLGSVQSFASGNAYQIVHFDTAGVDTRAAFSLGAWHFIVPVSGLYDLNVSLELAPNVSTVPTDVVHKLAVFIGGVEAATKKLFLGDDDTDKQIDLSRKFQLLEGQVVDVRFKTEVGSNALNMDAQVNPLTSILQIARISA